ncbi:MAG: hypothetical protein ACP5I1_09460, partial [Candidatus Hinthialibacter sp.]
VWMLRELSLPTRASSSIRKITVISSFDRSFEPENVPVGLAAGGAGRRYCVPPPERMIISPLEFNPLLES